MNAIQSFIAHKTDENKEHLLREHLTSVSLLSQKFATSFGLGLVANQIGLLHDLGKYSMDFQRRIRGSNILVDHSTAGAQYAFTSNDQGIGLIIAYCIAGHHAGLPDYGYLTDNNESPSLSGRLKKDIPDYSGYSTDRLVFESQKKEVLFDSINKSSHHPDFCLSFLTRMLFSCLVDADYLDTEKFMNPKIDRKVTYNFDTLNSKFDDYMNRIFNNSTELGKLRHEIYSACIHKANEAPGIMSLNVPTGGGKTLSSMGYALKHLHNHHKDRIIYVIPYTSIIEQTAAIFKSIFGEELVLEHHYHFDFEDEEEGEIDPTKARLRFASQTWDYPIIVTTNVQFFESLYSNKTGRCRKLHNIANSIIIFDEIQLFPYDFLKPCLMAIDELVKNYQCSVVLCSATQPNYQKIAPYFQPRTLCSVSNANPVFHRVTHTYLGKIALSDLIEKVRQYSCVLIIVNSRKAARDIANELDAAYCLTTLMTPNDRTNLIKKLKEILWRKDQCFVVSTQLIEAGVDIDFPVVFRMVAGVDSIHQAAGRCNREGNLNSGLLYTFTIEGDKDMRGHIGQSVALGKLVINQSIDPLSEEAVDTYFEEAFRIKNLDKKNIIDYFVSHKKNTRLQYFFDTAAKEFCLIESEQVPIIIPTSKNENTIRELKRLNHPEKALRKLQGDTVMVFKNECKALLQKQIIREIVFGVYALLQERSEFYSPVRGLDIFSSEDKNNTEVIIL
ncbi:MAG: CRISPR-associated helicase Cas3' [Candidatus Izemoplasmatales bacterium]|jgi:CRISPR-associated helicase Cas3/CRISPR-associated endonuclease Cas3-HD